MPTDSPLEVPGNSQNRLPTNGPEKVQTMLLPSEDAVALAAAQWLAEAALAAVQARGQFLLAVSGGKTPWVMLRHLAQLDLPWPQIHLFQVDERVAPEGDADRNLTHLQDCLASVPSLPAANIHAMPVTLPDLEAAAAEYARTLTTLAGQPPVLDVVHLGLGTDGHTASLVPGDAVLQETARWVAPTGAYQGRQRLTLTYPVLNSARQILWIATGSSKRDMLARLYAQDTQIPAGVVTQKSAVVFTDQDV